MSNIKNDLTLSLCYFPSLSPQHLKIKFKLIFNCCVLLVVLLLPLVCDRNCTSSTSLNGLTIKLTHITHRHIHIMYPSLFTRKVVLVVTIFGNLKIGGKATNTFLCPLVWSFCECDALLSALSRNYSCDRMLAHLIAFHL